MSASSKKKLRKEQNAAAMTERQQREQKEAKSLKTYTIVFVTSIILIVAIGLGLVATNLVNNSGVIERNTLALTVNEHELNVAELNYFYLDSARTLYNNYYSQYKDMASLYMQFGLGLNPAEPLSKQVYDPETGKTWADYFVDTAISDAKYYYAIYDHAVANGYTLPEDKVDELEATFGSVDLTAQMQGFSNTEDFLKQSYGFGATYESYKNYITVVSTVQNYVQEHYDGLKYTENDLSTYEADKKHEFNSYSYASYQISYANFLGEGTKDEEGNTTYTDEQTAAAIAEAKAAAESLAGVKTVEELDAAIAKLAMNEGAKEAPTSTKNTKVLYSNLNETVRDWVADEARQENDVAVLPYTVTDENGEETTTAYIVVIFNAKYDNVEKMANVRHYLVQFEGGTTDSATGQTVYSDEKKAAAEKEAREALATWKSGDATEDTFIEMVKKSTDDTASKSTGGLYEDINYDSGYVTNFKNWALDPTRQAGDADVVETEYGYHVMYYVGDSEQTYRDYMVENAIRAKDHQEWADAIVEAATSTTGNTDRITKNYVMAQY